MQKKALIAAAVTAALVASANVSADTKVYGKIHTSIASVSQDDSTDKTSATEIKSNASRFGIKGSKELENGMTFKGQFEFEVAARRAQVTQSELVLRVILAARHGKSQRLCIKLLRFLQIHDPDAGVYHPI